MKKMILALVALFCMTVSSSAMSYEQAREQALFLTDKMAYELNLTDDQYEAAYEINLDYLMGVNHYDDLYGSYWRQRNMDLSYILYDWQYQAYLNASYFYRPLYWDGGYWHFGIYARYPHRDYFYFGRPHFFNVYRGGHSWRMNGGRSWYSGRQFGGPRPGGERRVGMRDGFNRGDFGRGQSFGNLTQRNNNHNNNMERPNNSRSNNGYHIGGPQRNNQNTRSFGNANRESSTRTTVTRNRSFNNNDSKMNSRSFGNSTQRNNVFGGNRNSNNSSNSTRSFTPRSTPSTGSSFNESRSFGGGSRNSGTTMGGTRSYGGASKSHGGGGGSFGGRR